MSLMKPSSGLPKFAADCGFWRHPRWLGADIDELGLFVAGVSYCYEHGTDGSLPPRSTLAAGLGLPEKQVRKALEKLLQRGALIDCVTYIEIDGYLDHNPSAKEVTTAKERRSKAGKKGADARWNADATSESDTNRNADANGHRYSTELTNERTNAAASARGASREPPRPAPRPLEHCPTCGRLTLDCTCPPLYAVGAS